MTAHHKQNDKTVKISLRNYLESELETLREHVTLFLLPVVTSCCSCPLQTITCIITWPLLFFFLSVARRRAAPGRRGLRGCFSFTTLGQYWGCVWARPPAQGGRGASARQREQHRRHLAVRRQGSAPLSG